MKCSSVRVFECSSAKALAVALAGAVAGCAVFCGGPTVVEQKPGESLVALRDRVRALDAAAKAKGVEVRLAPGRTELSESLKFAAADSGSPTAPIVWRGAKDGTTQFTAGRAIPASWFKPVEGKPGMVVADVSAWKVKWPAKPHSECSDPYPFAELFVDGERCEIAGWPDWPTVADPSDDAKGWATVKKFVDPGTIGGSGSAFDAGKKTKQPPKPHGATFGYDGDRPSRWLNAKDLVTHGFWCFDWSDSRIAVKEINVASNTITHAFRHWYGVKRGNPSPRRWRAVNLLEELDRPGEYFVDVHSSKVYLIPRRPLSKDADVLLTWRPHHVVECSGVANFSLRDVEVFGSWRDAIHGYAVTNVVFDSLVVHGTRMRGFDVSRAWRSAVRNCHVYDLGNGGVYFTGGSRRHLLRGENRIENNLIHGFSKNRLTSAYAIIGGGCGNVARHNEVFDAPHQAISMNGNDNVFEYNVVSNVLQCTDDAGAYYVGRNPSCRGNVIRWNLFADIGSERGHGNAAIYFDDGNSGDEVVGNVFLRSGAPGRGSFGTVFSHGGYSNIVRNCLFVDCKRPLGSAPWKQDRWESYMAEPFMQDHLKKEVDIESEIYLRRYPALKNFFPGHPDDTRWNAAFDNVFVKIDSAVSGRWFTNSTDVVVQGLPHGYCLEAYNAMLPEPIPLDKIGRDKAD